MAGIVLGPVTDPLQVTLTATEDWVANFTKGDGSDWADGEAMELWLIPLTGDTIVWTTTVDGATATIHKAASQMPAVIAAQPKTARLRYIDPAGVPSLVAKAVSVSVA
jgi:hypothetical protein